MTRANQETAFAADLNADGFVHERNFLSKKTVKDLILITDWLYDVLGNAEATGEEFGKTDAAQYIISTNKGWSGLQLDTVQEFLKEQKAEFSPQFEAIVAEFCLKMQAILGDNWYWHPEGSFFRRLTKTPAHVPWHSDAEAASTLKLGARAITVWVPLVSVGSENPSLDFIRGSHVFMQNPGSPMPADRHRPDDWVADVAGDRVTPSAEPGDVLIFDEFTLHRTQTLSGAFSQRTSCEFRFALPGLSRSPEDAVVPKAQEDDVANMDHSPSNWWQRLMAPLRRGFVRY